MCVHVKVFHSKVKAVNMLTAHSVESSVSQVIIDCFSEHAYSTCVCQLYLLDLRFINLYPWFGLQNCLFIMTSLVLFDYSPCFQISFLLLAKEFMLLTFFLSLNVCSRFSHWIPASVFIPNSGAILIVCFVFGYARLILNIQ